MPFTLAKTSSLMVSKIAFLALVQKNGSKISEEAKKRQRGVEFSSCLRSRGT